VIVVLANADGDQNGRFPDPGGVTEERGDAIELLAVGNDDEPLALAEARARRAANGGDDPLQRIARNRIRLVGPRHSAMFENVSELHDRERIRRVIRRRVVVHGYVQGVFFRDSTRRLAEQHGVAGWVANRWDGTVEAVFEGEPDAVERLVRFVHEGPRGAQVEQVEVFEEEPEGVSDFTAR
jgi:acylphosphatase